MKRAATIITTLLALLLSAGCVGDVELMADNSVETSFPSGKTPDGQTGEPGNGETTPPPAFELVQENTQLLPFHIRMAKLSRVTGLAQDDPAFDEIWRNRYALGDHNYGQGIGPDLTWSANKMSVWVRALRPVCQSAQMRERYADLPTDLNALIMAGYGREAEEADLQVVEDALAEEGVADTERYDTVCLSILTSMEFVSR